MLENCLLYEEVLGPCALHRGYDYLSVGIDGANPETCDFPPDIQDLFEKVRVVGNPIVFLYDLIAHNTHVLLI